MNWLWILGVWTGLGILWWVIASLLVAFPKKTWHSPHAPDRRKISVFKPLAGSLSNQEFERLRICIESFIADLDENSELLIGCHLVDAEKLQGFVQQMNKRYPNGCIKLIVHPHPDRFAHPKVSWLHILAPHATGELWLLSDADIQAPPGTIRSLRMDFASMNARMVTSPYVIRRLDKCTELLDTLYINLELFPGVVLLDHLNLIRFAFGSGMLFEADDFRNNVDWDFLGGCLAEDFHLGRLLAPTRLGSMRLNTIPGSRSWRGAALHYLRWQKTVRWCRPGAFAAQLMILPVVGWVVWLLFNPTHLCGWIGLLTVFAVDTVAAWTICRILKCAIDWRHIAFVSVWSLFRGLAWGICWIPWPVVWRGRKWWAPHDVAKSPTDVLNTRRQHGLD